MLKSQKEKKTHLLQDINMNSFTQVFKIYNAGDLPGGTVVRTLCSQCRGPGFEAWSGN